MWHDDDLNDWADDLEVDVPEFNFPRRPAHGGFPSQERYAGTSTTRAMLHQIIPAHEAQAILKAANAAEDGLPEVAECYRAVAGYDGLPTEPEPRKVYDWEQDGE